MERPSQPPPILGEFDAAMKNSGFGEPISSPWNRTNDPAFVQTECVTSDSAKQLMSSLADDDCPGNSGGFPMDEKGRIIEDEEDSRLHDKDYFIQSRFM